MGRGSGLEVQDWTKMVTFVKEFVKEMSCFERGVEVPDLGVGARLRVGGSGLDQNGHVR